MNPISSSCSGLSHPKRPSRGRVSLWPLPSLSHVERADSMIPCLPDSSSASFLLIPPPLFVTTSLTKSQIPGHNPAFSELGSER